MEAKTAPVWKKAGYTLRLAQREDAEAYYAQNSAPLDPEAVRDGDAYADAILMAMLEDEWRALQAENQSEP